VWRSVPLFIHLFSLQLLVLIFQPKRNRRCAPTDLLTLPIDDYLIVCDLTAGVIYTRMQERNTKWVNSKQNIVHY